MEQLRALVPGANIVLPRERTHCHGVLIYSRKVIRERPIDVAHPMKTRGQQSTEDRDETGAQKSLKQVLPTVEVGHYYILSIVYTGQGDVNLPVYSFVGILWQVLFESLQQDGVYVESGTEGPQAV